MTCRERIPQTTQLPSDGAPPIILLVDDEQAIVDLLHDMLHDEGYAVATANNGMTALAIAATTPVALVITDLMMPHMDGMALCEQLRSNPRTAAVPVLLMTAARQSINTQLFNAVVPKPFNLADLLVLISRFASEAELGR